MHSILAIDTSAEACSVAISSAGSVYREYRSVPRGHTRLILPMIDAVLRKAGKKLADLDALAYTRGPGSFTGLRIGAGVVQGLAFGANLPVVPVSTLQVMACGAMAGRQLKEGDLVLPALDARMDEVSWAVYRVTGGRPETCLDDRMTVPERLAEELTSNDLDKPIALGVGSGWKYVDRMGIQVAEIIRDVQPDAQYILSLAARELKAGNHQEAKDVQPLYLRDEVTWQKRKKLSP